MKNFLVLFSILVLSIATMAQTPKISFQAVVRDANNHLVMNTAITVDVTVSDGVHTYNETGISATTNANGLLSLTIGNGSNFDAIDWDNATIKTTVHIGSETVTNEVPVTAVPYAIHANYSNDVNPASSTIVDIYNKIAVDSTDLANRIAALNTKIVADSTTLANRIDALEMAQEENQDIIDSLKDVISKIQNNLSVPTVTTSEVTDVAKTGATFTGNVVSEGNTTVTERGFC